MGNKISSKKNHMTDQDILTGLPIHEGPRRIVPRPAEINNTSTLIFKLENLIVFSKKMLHIYNSFPNSSGTITNMKFIISSRKNLSDWNAYVQPNKYYNNIDWNLGYSEVCLIAANLSKIFYPAYTYNDLLTDAKRQKLIEFIYNIEFDTGCISQLIQVFNYNQQLWLRQKTNTEIGYNIITDIELYCNYLELKIKEAENKYIGSTGGHDIYLADNNRRDSRLGRFNRLNRPTRFNNPTRTTRITETTRITSPTRSTEITETTRMTRSTRPTNLLEYDIWDEYRDNWGNDLYNESPTSVRNIDSLQLEEYSRNLPADNQNNNNNKNQTATILSKKITNPTLNTSTDTPMCISCMSFKPNYILIPCGHPHMCVKCHEKWLNVKENKKCAICKTIIEKYVVTFL